MLSYTPNKPDWCYSYIDIPNLEKIQEELLQARDVCNITLQNNPYYINFSREEIYEHIPLLLDYLKQIGVEKKLWRIMFSAKSLPESRYKKQSAIHVDAVNKHITHSLNIPIRDCENTYTVWYRGRVELLNQEYNHYIGHNEKPLKNFAIVNENSAKEICRVETIRPMLVNTTIPHRGISNTESRVLCCIRFKPDLTEEEFVNITTI